LGADDHRARHGTIPRLGVITWAKPTSGAGPASLPG
jgi:hypothetical protein